MGSRDRAVADLAVRADRTVLVDAVDEVHLVRVAVLRLVEVNLRILEVTPLVPLTQVFRALQTADGRDRPLLADESDSAPNARLHVRDVRAHAVRVDEVEVERACPGEHFPVVLPLGGGEVLDRHRAGAIHSYALVQEVELVCAEVGDHSAAVAPVPAPAHRLVYSRDERFILPMGGRALPERPRLLREIRRYRTAVSPKPVPPLAAGTSRDGHVDALDRAEVAVDRQLCRHAMTRIAAPLVANLERDAGLLSRAHHRLPFGYAQSERLLAVDMLAALHGLDGNERVPVVGRDDRHGVDRWVVYHAPPVFLHAARRVPVLLVHHALEHEPSARQMSLVAVSGGFQHRIASHDDLDARVLQKLVYVVIRLGAATDDSKGDALGSGRTVRRGVANGEKAAASAERKRRRRAKKCPARNLHRNLHKELTTRATGMSTCLPTLKSVPTATMAVIRLVPP